MRIIAGEFRRRRLLANPGLTTRPITDRVKEILFERTQDLLVDRRIADIFSGTGSLGFEALSRGAQSVVFLESDGKAFELLKQNVAALGVEDRTLCWRTDALKSSFHPKGVDAFLPYDVVFFDPPYRMVAGLAGEADGKGSRAAGPRGRDVRIGTSLFPGRQALNCRMPPVLGAGINALHFFDGDPHLSKATAAAGRDAGPRQRELIQSRNRVAAARTATHGLQKRPMRSSSARRRVALSGRSSGRIESIFSTRPSICDGIAR